jgi:hypothetical protein
MRRGGCCHFCRTTDFPRRSGRQSLYSAPRAEAVVPGHERGGEVFGASDDEAISWVGMQTGQLDRPKGDGVVDGQKP